MKRSIEKRVDAGAVWLDKNFPDWLQKIDLKHLRLDSSCSCVLGQVFGDYSQAPLGKEIDYDVEASMFGFEVMMGDGYIDHGDEYEALTSEWRKLISQRQEAVEYANA